METVGGPGSSWLCIENTCAGRGRDIGHSAKLTHDLLGRFLLLDVDIVERMEDEAS